jgi:hypothetical protein
MPDEHLIEAVGPKRAKQQREHHPQSMLVEERHGKLRLIPFDGAKSRIFGLVATSPTSSRASARPRERREARHQARSTSSGDSGDDGPEPPPPRAVYAYGCLGPAERGEAA